MRNVVQQLSLLLCAATAYGQQVPDSTYRFEIQDPAYSSGTGPHVCIDEAHHNFHTMGGRYMPFAALLRDDGFNVQEHPSEFSAETLHECDIVVIANAVGEENAGDRSYPHSSAFSQSELEALLMWLHDGGSLLLIADHPPWPGAASALALLLGVQMLDGSVDAAVFGAPDEDGFRKSARLYGMSVDELRQEFPERGQLGTHAILRGRGPTETVRSVVTFTGQAFYPSEIVEPLLILDADATAVVYLGRLLGRERQRFPVGGWLQGGALRLGQGRVVILGEAAMCTAQVFGPERIPGGMNDPLAPQNAQFCLSIVRWLSGLLDE